MISFNLFNILHVNVTIIYILWISVFSSSVPGYAGLARLAGLTVLGRTRTANPLLTGSGFLALAWKLATIVRASQPMRQPVSKILTANKSHVVDNNKANTTKIDVTIVLFMNKHISPVDIHKNHQTNFNYTRFSWIQQEAVALRQPLVEY